MKSAVVFFQICALYVLFGYSPGLAAPYSETTKVDEVWPYLTDVNEESTTFKQYSTSNRMYRAENPIMMILRQDDGIRLLPIIDETTTLVPTTTFITTYAFSNETTTSAPITTTLAPTTTTLPPSTTIAPTTTVTPTTSSTTMQPITTNTPQTAKQNKVTCALCIIVMLNN
ncbi:uncharacterized protein LOC126549209 [Aphis gossypii]|uniref:uncharacterized protein LOC126549209 n=1 Tax=Aphis gossypii TaxID=80765 RepID=UPI0021591411|nr:uncharacterized protein LOC126549209 [Aphis gossypii]